MNINTTTTTRTENVHTIKLTREDILELLRGNRPRSVFNIPDDAEVFVSVPGGGDWSRTDMNLDEDRPVIIRWTETILQGSTK